MYFLLHNSLVDNLAKRHIANVIVCLHNAHSHLMDGWRKLNGRITEAHNQSKDNCKFLKTLAGHLTPLATRNPVCLSYLSHSLLGYIFSL